MSRSLRCASLRYAPVGTTEVWFPATLRSHPRDAEGDGIERSHHRLAGDGEGEGQDAAGIARVDDAVVPQMRGAVERGRFALELVDDRLVHLFDLLLRRLLALAQELLLGHGLHH